MTVTVPVMPVPVTTSPTAIMPVCPSTTKVVVLVVPLTVADRKSVFVNVNTTSFVRVCAEDKTKLFWSVKEATVTVPVIPVPLTTSPTAIMPVFPSTAKLAMLLIVPFTVAVGVEISSIHLFMYRLLVFGNSVSSKI